MFDPMSRIRDFSLWAKLMGRQWWRFVVATGMGSFADGLGWIIIPLLAAKSGGSPFEVSFLLLARGVFPILLSPVIGWLVDLRGYRWGLVFGNLVKGAIFVVIATSSLSGHQLMNLLIIASFLIGVAQSLYDIASTSAVVHLCQRMHFAAANSILSSTQSLANTLLGAIFGGVLFAVSPKAAFILAATVYGITGLLHHSLTSLPDMRHVESVTGSDSQQRSETSGFWIGIKTLRGHKGLQTTLLTSVCINIAYGSVFSILVLFLTKDLRVTSAQYGLTMAIGGCGALLGAITSPSWRKYPIRIVLLASVSMIVVAYSLLALSHVFFGAAIALSVGSFFTMVWNVHNATYKQSSVTRHTMGRVSGVSRSFGMVGQPVGILAGSTLADLFGNRAAVMGGIVFSGIGVAVMLFFGKWVIISLESA